MCDLHYAQEFLECCNETKTADAAAHVQVNHVEQLGIVLRSKLFVLISCSVIAALSFWSTLVLLDYWKAEALRQLQIGLGPGAPQTTLEELPRLPDERLSWLGIGGLNAQVIAGVPGVVSGLPALRLIAVQDGVHTVAARVTGLIKNERYRITAWIAPGAVGNFGIAARDQADKSNGPNNGRAIFNPTTHNVVFVDGNGRPGIEQVGDWLIVWLDLPTTDGQYVINFYVYNGTADTYPGEGTLGVILGGISVD